MAASLGVSELRVDSWSKQLVVEQLQAGKNVSMEAEDIAGIRHQATSGEDTADWEDFVRAVVNCRLYELATALQLLVVMSCVYKCSINPIADQNRACSHIPYVWLIIYPLTILSVGATDSGVE
jgi:hypothetical protein